jgi:2-iminobutanoate/2-iminopropanoate deaminase
MILDNRLETTVIYNLTESIPKEEVIGVTQEVKNYPEFWGGKKLAYPHVAAEAPKFSRSVVVGNLIFVSGCQGMNPETLKTDTDVFEEQMVIALDKVKMAMEEAGSSMNNVVRTLMLLKNLEDYPRMRKTELEYYQKHAPFLVDNPPASTFMQVASLARPEFLVEIDVIGVISRE